MFRGKIEYKQLKLNKMAELIKDLPEGLRKLAESRVDRDWDSHVDDGKLVNAFSWSGSLEGYLFWERVFHGDYSEYYNQYPLTPEEATPPEGESSVDCDGKSDRIIRSEEEFVKAIKVPGVKVMRDGGALRYNEGKVRYDLLHPVATEGIAKVLTKGAEKYAERNWERGMSWSSVLASMKRHIAAFESGEDYDPETGLLHVDHVQCNAHFLSAFYKIYPKGDDRRHHYLDTPKIGLDIDEVLCDWVGEWCDMRELETPTSWYFDRGLIKEFEKMESEGRLDEFYLGLKPLVDPKDIPFEPHCYITSRPVDTAVTEEWLAKHGFPARPVYTVGQDGESKVEIAKAVGVEVFADDCFKNFKELNEAGITCYLYDTPHNQRYQVGYKRIKSLKELAQ